MRHAAVGVFFRLALPVLFAALLAPSSAAAKPSATPFSIEPGSFQVTPSNRSAGAHSDLTISFGFSREPSGKPFNDVKDVEIELPPGFAGAASAVPTCSAAQLIVDGTTPECPLDSQVGTVTLEFSIAINSKPQRWTLPLFNMERSAMSTPAQLGFRALIFSQLVPMSIRPEDGGLTVDVSSIPLVAEPSEVALTIWAVPASPAHDLERGKECTDDAGASCSGGGNPATVAPQAFLSNPTRCGSAPARMEATSWEAPEDRSKASADAGPIGGCEQVPFEPSVQVEATTDAAESPTGLDLSIRVPQNASPDELVSSSLAGIALTLPEGFTTNPAAVAGVCTRHQFESESALPDAAGCPGDAALGTAEIETPLLPEPARGTVYVAKPFDNPSGSLLGLYVVARAPASGVFVRFTGRVVPDSQTGQLRIVFDDVPQLSLSRLALRLPKHPGSLLVTPPSCGSYEAQTVLAPSSVPDAPRLLTGRLAVGSGVGGGPCPAAGGLPFHPQLTTRSLRRGAGKFSPFSLHLRRQDGEAQIARLALGLPAGVVASLIGVPVCAEAALATARAKAGAEERMQASCPAGSSIGRILVSAGVADRIASVRGALYLAGPYRGARLSIAAVVPALLGPFDLGTEVLRAPLEVDPGTGEIRIGWGRADPIPQVLSGISLHLRGFDVFLNRPRFLRNPTSCRPLATKVTLASAAIGAATPLPVTLSAPFRARGCEQLPFSPQLRLGLFGGVHRNGHPGLRIALGSERREAGLSGATIELPHAVLLDPARIRGICTPELLRKRRCPGDSAYGFAEAFSTLVPEPLKGPVHLRATKRGLPTLAAVLSSSKLDVRLNARLVAVPGALRIVPTAVPDLPISRLVLTMKGGKAGLLVNSVDLCTAPRRADVDLLGQNGKRRKLRPAFAIACPGPDRGREHLPAQRRR